MFNQAETYFKHSEFRRSFKGGQRGQVFFQKAANKENFVICLHDVKVSWRVTTYPAIVASDFIMYNYTFLCKRAYLSAAERYEISHATELVLSVYDNTSFSLS